MASSMPFAYRWRPLVFLCLLCSPLQAAETVEIPPTLDYKTLDHRLELVYLRAGNHDREGLNSYYFQLSLIGLLDEEKEHILPFDEKKKLVEEFNKFGNMKLKALSFYEKDKKAKSTIELRLPGDSVRELVRKMMNKFATQEQSVAEDKVAVLVKIQLYEEEKKYWVLADDKMIAETQYFVLPFKSSGENMYEDQKLLLQDTAGLQVILSLSYEQNQPKTSPSGP